MSIESDIVTALASIASGRVYPSAPPESAPVLPLVVFKRTAYRPLIKLTGPEGTANSEFTFECWGKQTASVTAKQSALTLASQVRTAIEAAAGLVNKYEIQPDAEKFDPEMLETMEPVSYSFWHST